MNCKYDTFDSRRVHGKEKLFAIRSLAYTILDKLGDSACIIGGCPRDLLVQDAHARDFLQKDNLDFMKRSHDPSSFHGRHVLPKDIDLLVFDLSPADALDRIKDAISSIPMLNLTQNQRMQVVGFRELSTYIMPSFIQSVHRAQFVYRCGGFANRQLMTIDLDIIAIDKKNRSEFLQAIPFTYDDIQMTIRPNLGSDVVRHAFQGVAPIHTCFNFYLDNALVHTIDPKMKEFHTLLRCVTDEYRQAYNILRRSIHKTALGWKVHGLGFKLQTKNNVPYIVTNNGLKGAWEMLEQFDNEHLPLYTNGVFRTPSHILRLLPPAKTPLVIAMCQYDETSFLSTEEATEEELDMAPCPG